MIASNGRNKVNVLHLTETSEPGGSETVLANIARYLDQNRYTSLVCLLEKGWLSEVLDSCGIEYVILENKKSYDPSFLARLMKLIKKRKIDIIHAHEFMMNVYGSVAGKLTGTPMIGTVHGKGYFTEKKTRIMSYKLAVFLGRKMILVSEDLRKYFVENLGLQNTNKLMTIYNGIDTEKYGMSEPRQDLRADLNIGTDSVIGCTIGSLFTVKGITYLLKAVKMVIEENPKFKLLIAGEGDQATNLEREATELALGDAVEFLGFRNDIPNILNAADFYICSSLSEGLSLSILEAMSAGKPVLATNVGGNPELIKDGVNGFLVHSSDPDSLAAKIKILAGDADLRNMMSLKSREIAIEKFSMNRMISDYQNLYEDLLR